MTLEGVIMIIVLCLVFLKLVFSRAVYTELGNFRKGINWKPFGELALYFALTVVGGLLITNLIIGLILINSIIWAVQFSALRSIGYGIVSWVSLLVFWLFTHATYVSFDGIPFSEIWYISLFCWGFSLLFILIYETFGKFSKILASILVAILAMGLVLLPSIFIIYEFSFGSPMEAEPLYAIYQTNYREAIEFTGIFLSSFTTLLVPLALIGLLILFFKQGYTKRTALKNQTYLLLAAGILLIANLDVPFKMKVPKMVAASVETYFGELDKFKKIQKQRKLGEIKLNASKENNKELYVVIIGESLNKNHMSLYGYHRNTSPLLSKLYRDSVILKFEEAFSTHTHTVQVLTKALTASDHFNQQDYFSAPSIVDVFEAAGFDSYWLTNQLSLGPWDNPVSVLTERADHRISINGNIGEITSTTVHDDALVPKLEDVLSNELENNTVIFVHLMGNHGDYNDRYPRQFERYTKDARKRDFGRADIWSQSVNTYDNSVLFNDSVVYSLLNVVRKRAGISACFYFADHGEDVVMRKWHNSLDFTYAMAQIPLIFWCSDEFKQAYPGKYSNLQKNIRKPFASDHIYDLCIGLAGIEFDQYSEQHDLSNANYNLSIDDCFSVDGKFSYGSPDNFLYHIRQNAPVLHSLDTLDRVYPHRVNSLGKLSTALYHGFNSFEVDVLFREIEGETYFEVGHNEGDMSGMKLEEWITFTNGVELQKLWLDIKNMGESNMTAILDRLEELDGQFGLKKYAIVESGTSSQRFSAFSKAGYHTSYYLPTEIKDLKGPVLPRKARELADQLKMQEVSAVSFDYRLYPFVKDHLEKLLDEQVVYHTWDLSLKLANPSFQKDLLERDFYHDPRMHSILINYQSEFEF